MNNTGKILQLSMMWYEYINLDHHKDCDCHWYIREVWSYGELPKYHIQHKGYIYEINNSHTYKTKTKAERALIEEIKKAFLIEYNWCCQMINDEGADKRQKDQAKWLIDRYEKIKAI